MSANSWKLWVIPFSLWGLSMTWYAGYQSGYHEGHETAWRMTQPNIALTEIERAQQTVFKPQSIDTVEK